jgi:hypothetical protein
LKLAMSTERETRYASARVESENNGRERPTPRTSRPKEVEPVQEHIDPRIRSISTLGHSIDLGRPLGSRPRSIFS